MKLPYVFILPILIFFFGCADINDKSSNRPNIIFFFVDDMGWQETSVPFYSEKTSLNDRYFTPNMEKLAMKGIKFTQAYACAVCSPSRISLMTGMNAARHMVTNWTLRKDQSPDQPNDTIESPKWNVNGLSAKEGQSRAVYSETLPQKLKQVGYRTIHVGKAHFGARQTSGEDPKNLGFDVNIAGHAAGGPGSYLGKYNYSAIWRAPKQDIWDVPGLDKYHGTDTFLTEALTIEASKAIKDAVEREKPFYLYMSHYAIHAPWEKDDRFYQKYVDRGLDEFDATYASMIEGMDQSLGDIVEMVDELGVMENTIFVFMSDNGSPSQADQNLPLRGHKLTPYEGGVRVPMIVKWSGVTQENSTNNQYLIIEDIFPSFLEMAGIDFEKSDETDGVSFVPLLKGEGDYPKNRPIFWHYPNTYNQPPYSAIRQGKWKLIYHHTNRKLELFNLEEDISERNNLAFQNREKTHELSRVLTDHLLSSGALMPWDKIKQETVPYPIEVIKL